MKKSSYTSIRNKIGKSDIRGGKKTNGQRRHKRRHKEDTKRQPISQEMRGMQVQILTTYSHSSDGQRFKVDIMMMSESELTHGCAGNGWQVLRYFSLHSQGGRFLRPTELPAACFPVQKHPLATSGCGANIVTSYECNFLIKPA